MNGGGCAVELSQFGTTMPVCLSNGWMSWKGGDFKYAPFARGWLFATPSAVSWSDCSSLQEGQPALPVIICQHCRGDNETRPPFMQGVAKTQIPRGKPGLPPGDGVDFHDLTSGDLAAEVVRISDELPRWLALCGACAKFAQAEQSAQQEIIPKVFKPIYNLYNLSKIAAMKKIVHHAKMSKIAAMTAIFCKQNSLIYINKTTALCLGVPKYGGHKPPPYLGEPPPKHSGQKEKRISHKSKR